MTEPTAKICERAIEIIAAYGADSARWPDAERAMVLELVAADPILTAALGAARELDADIVGWARRPERGGDPIAAAAIAMRRPRNIMRWAASGSIAASLAVAIVLLTPARMPPPSIPTAVALVAVSDEAAFAQVFTPTPDEERVL